MASSKRSGRCRGQGLDELGCSIKAGTRGERKPASCLGKRPSTDHSARVPTGGAAPDRERGNALPCARVRTSIFLAIL